MDEMRIDLIRKVELFSSLSNTELQQISNRVVLRTFARSEVILHEEDTTEYMYIVLSGKVKAFQTTSEGKETILAIHSEGDHFGELALIDGRTAHATVSAIENSLIALISSHDFHVLLAEQKKIFENLFQFFCKRLRESWNKIQLLNSKNASDRIKMLLIMMSEEHGKRSSEGTTILIRLTHQDIADMTGLTRETVTRILHTWRREKIIKVLKNRFLQLSPDFLLSGFCNVI